MGLFSPWFLSGLAAVGVPVFVHLLRRQTTTPRPFSSLMFFEPRVQSSTRHRRLRYLLLFALRATLLLLIVLAFANPFVHRARAGANEKLMLLVVDNSFSMRAGKPHSRLEDAKQAALALLASRPPGQPAQIMALGGQLQLLTQPLRDRAALTDALQAISPSDGHGNFGELGRGIRALGEATHTPIEMHLFSDMQRSNMPANFADLLLPQNVKLVLHSEIDGHAQDARPNWAVDSIEAPAQLTDAKSHKRSLIKGVLVGYNTPLALRTASLIVDGKTVATRKVTVPPNGRVRIEFEAPDLPHGFSRCQISIDSADDLQADDAALFAVRRSDPERVLFVHQASDRRSLLYFSAALQAAGQSSFVLQAVQAEQTGDLDPSKYSFVVLSDVLSLPSSFENALARHVQNGGGVLIAAGLSAAHHAQLPLFGGTVSDTHIYSREGSFGRAGSFDSTHPVMQATNSGEAVASAADWSDSRFYYIASIEPGNGRVVVRLTDGTPLLVDKKIGEGHVLLLASGLDNVTNDMPLHPAFVPFVDQASHYLSGSDRFNASRLVDSFVQLRAADAQAGGEGKGVEIVDPEGHRPLSLSEAGTIHSYQLRRAGFYQVRYANGHDALIAVNTDRRESDLAPIPKDLLRLWSGGSAASPSGQPLITAADSDQRTTTSYRLWWYVMLLALAAAVAESTLASFYLGTQREDA